MILKSKILVIALGAMLLVSCGQNPTAPRPGYQSHNSSIRSVQSSSVNAVIEAENFGHNSGTQTEACAEGGQDVGWIDNGDWLGYEINFGNGADVFRARVASDTAGGTIEIRLGNPTSGTLIGSVAIVNTGGWQLWTTVETNIQKTYGFQHVYLVFKGGTGGLFNINWFKFYSLSPTVISAFSRIEAEGFSFKSGTETEVCREGGQDIGWINNGNYLVFDQVDFGSGVLAFQARVASDGGGGTIEIHLDSQSGPVIGTLTVSSTGGWQNWATMETSVVNMQGLHPVYLIFRGGGGGLFNINWFQFSVPDSYDIFNSKAAAGVMNGGSSSITFSRYNRGLVTSFQAYGRDGWCGVWVQVNGGQDFDASAYQGIKFRAYSAGDLPWIEFEIRDSHGDHGYFYRYGHWDYTAVPVAKWYGSMPHVWTEYYLPLPQDKSSVKEFKVLFRAGLDSYPAPWFDRLMPVHSTVYIDDIRFVKTP